jgi:hypothetical protein
MTSSRAAPPATIAGVTPSLRLVRALVLGAWLASSCAYDPTTPTTSLGDAGEAQPNPPERPADGQSAPADAREEADGQGDGEPRSMADGPPPEASPADAADVAPIDAAPGDAPALPVDASPPVCVSAPEICDGRDNDCDGTIDDGYRVSSHPSSYTELKRYDSGCTAELRFGLSCVRAAHRLCMARGCANTGFAPIENSGDVAVVACVAQAAVRNVARTALTALQSACVASEPYSPGCNSAIHRYCLGQGFATGFGPVELSPTSALVSCLSGSNVSVISATFAALRAQQPDCTGDSERFGRACNAAVDRFCVARGALTGFGPVEASGGNATVVCLAP